MNYTIGSTMQQSSGEEFISDEETPSPSLIAATPPTQANTSIIDSWPCDHYDHPAVEHYEWYYEEDDAEELKQEVIDIVEDQKRYLTRYEQCRQSYKTNPLGEEQEPLERPWPWNAPGFLEGVHLEPEEDSDDQDDYIWTDGPFRRATDDDEDDANPEQEESLTLVNVNDSWKPALLNTYIQHRAITLVSEAIGETWWNIVERLHRWFRKEDPRPLESRRLWHALWWKCLEEAGGLPLTQAERVCEESKEAREEKTSDCIERCVEARLDKAELEEQGQKRQQEEDKETSGMVD